MNRMRMPLRQLLLILYAALGPPLLIVLYLFVRDHLGYPLSSHVEYTVLYTLVSSGAACAYIGLSGSRWIRVGMTLVYLCCAIAVTFFVGLTYECSRGNCL